MKILVYRWNAYNYEDIIANLRALGNQVEEMEYHLDNYDEAPEFEELLESCILNAKQEGARLTLCLRLTILHVLLRCVNVIGL